MFAYGFAIFIGAFLLFQVQPLMGKFLLPWFGGAPAVWTTCMLFFQVLLLGGYAYAHLTSRLLKPRGQVVLHLALLVLALATLPITPPASWKPAYVADPTLRIISLLGVSLGLPYFVLSATAPLLQHWFTFAHPGKSPFRLYALSNTGSLLALLTYPTLFENWLTRQAQASLWGAGLLFYALGCSWSGYQVWRAKASESIPPTPEVGPPRTLPGTFQRMTWLLFPACASVLLLAVTNKISQDVAVIPFLWVLPLSVYLLSFIICFDRPHWYQRAWAGPALVVALAAMTLTLIGKLALPTPAQILVYTAGLFVCCLVCHGEVYRLKPDPAYLTSFYLKIAGGGALGGVFVAVIAPKIFADYFELHWGLGATGLLFLIVLARDNKSRALRSGRGAALAAGTLGLAVLALVLWTDAHRYSGVRVYRSRDFYGVLNVYKHENQDPDLSLVELMHGRIAHGMQFLQPKRAGEPTLYFSPGSGIGRTFASLKTGPRRVGVVGLGAGTLAAYGRPGDRFCFYEINPEVEKVARTYFSFLRSSPGETSVVLGDARLTLESESPQDYDLLVLDAFDSDAIPVHLLTEEAFEVYTRHLKTNGVIAAHISNMSLNLEPVLLNVAKQFGFDARIIEYKASGGQWWILPSTWVVISKNLEFLQTPAIGQAARPPTVAGSKLPLWTDDFSGLFPILRWEHFLGRPARRVGEYTRAASVMAAKGDTAGAMAQYRLALKLDPVAIEPLNNLACLLAIASEPALRDGKEAVELSERACSLTDYRNSILVTTLAAAYAESGRYKEAVATAERAIDLALQQNQQQLVDRNKELLEYYRRNEAYHQPTD